MRELAALLEAHVRFEERKLSPLIEELLSEEVLNTLANAAAPESNSPIWGAESEELNATLLSWRPGAPARRSTSTASATFSPAPRAFADFARAEAQQMIHR